MINQGEPMMRMYDHPQFRHLRMVLMLLAMIGVVAACQPQTTYQKSYKMLSMSKDAIETLYQTVKGMHTNGQLDDAKFRHAGDMYDAAQTVQKQFIDAQIVALKSGTKTNVEQAGALGVAYMDAISEFITMAIEYKAIKADDPSIAVRQ